MRLFTGIAPAPHVLDNLARVLRDLRPLASLNWSPVENLHITSKFIGAWPEPKLPQLQTALQQIQPPEPFDVSITGFGFFPNPRHPKTFFAGVQSGPSLSTLAARIDAALQPLGVPVEDRPYTPHLTLARIKQENIRALQDRVAPMTNFDFGTFTVTQFHLYSSKTGPKGSVYTPLAAYPLTADASSQARPGHVAR